jgi:phenylacetate-CoA ligase
VTNGKTSKPGEIGEIVITDLNNYSVPLIRYRVGDLAVAVDNSTPCECGRNQPRIGKIQGRTQAIVMCGNGTWMPGTFFAHFFKDFESQIQHFQIHQSTPGDFLLKIVKAPGWSQAGFEEVLEKLTKYIGKETSVAVNFVEEIPLIRTGKRSPVVSTVEYDFQNVSSNLTDA